MEKKKGHLDMAREAVLSFQSDKVFTTGEVKKRFPSTNMNRLLNALVEEGLIKRISNGKWTRAEVTLVESVKPPEGETIVLSKKEKIIMDKIFNMNLKGYGGKSRFGLNKLKELLDEQEVALLSDLLPKLKLVKVLTCLADGKYGKVIEIDDLLFMRYLTEPSLIEEVNILDTEIDQRIEAFLKNEDRRKIELEDTNAQLIFLNNEISDREKMIEKVKTDLHHLQAEKENIIKKVAHIELYDEQFIELLKKMPPAKRRQIFKNILG